MGPTSQNATALGVRTSVNSLITNELNAQGITHVFGLPGEDNVALIADLSAMGIRFVGVRHESAAVLMADGYAWATAGLGVCTITRGPGLLNAMTAIRTAVQSNRQVLIITGDTPIDGSGPALKNIDQEPVCRAVGAEFFQVKDDAEVLPSLRAAIGCVHDGRPAVLAIATDILYGSADAEQGDASDSHRTAVASGSGPTAQDLSRVLELLRSARRPLILAGLGGSSDSCRDELIRLAERTGALLGTTLLAKGLFTGSRYDLGVVGGYASEPATPILAETDLVLAFGASLNSYTTANRTLFRTAEIVQVDVDPDHIGLDIPVTLGIVADAELTVRQLLPLIPGNDVAHELHAPALLDGLREPLYGGDDESTADELDPRIIVQVLDELLPADRVVVLDSGRFTTAPGRFLPVQTPRGIRHTAQAGSIGLGLGVALGAAVGRPDRTTLLFAGDGGFSMALADLETAGRHHIPMVMVVMNDRGYGAEMSVLRSHGMSIETSELPDMDFAAVARGCGVEGIQVESIEHLRSLGPTLARRTEPILLSCRIMRDLVVPRVTW